MDPGKPKHFTLDQLEDALRKSGGIQAYAAASLAKAYRRSFTRAAMNCRVKNSPRLQKVIAECIEEVKDLAENKVIRALRNNDYPTARWLLDRLARDRGYGFQQAVTGSDGEPLIPAGGLGAPQVHIYLPDNGRDPVLTALLEKAGAHDTRPNGATKTNGATDT